MASKPFSGNVVVLTGASSGIGRELTLQLAQQGALLALASHNVEQLQEVADLCRQRGGVHSSTKRTPCPLKIVRI